jgi:cytochrome c biogenesis protein CcdA
MTTIINQWLETISNLISDAMWVAPLLALVAGLLTALTPCSLSTVPLVIGYVGGIGSKDTKKAFQLSVTFAAGMAATFTALGVIASLAGKLVQGAGSWWYLTLGVLMLLMALQTWEVVHIIPSSFATSMNTKKGYFGAFLSGILGGLFASPCATPVLVVLLAIVVNEGNLLWGILLLLLYSIGHSVLVVVAGTSMGFVQKIRSGGRYGSLSNGLKIFTGFIILVLALYMFYLGF